MIEVGTVLLLCGQKQFKYNSSLSKIAFSSLRTLLDETARRVKSQNCHAMKGHLQSQLLKKLHPQ
jgi:hypothetical protein